MIFKKKYYWIAGTLVALSGVGLVRLVAPKYLPGSASMVIALIGYTLVIAGLFSLTLATREDD
jgi:hypothetical protein